ncbi:hypothetical protein K432DRAFT_380969 [Lepidopterella palustris CBS 459.81]|uniref:Uncharacterized protein n=1 Tax=Lepidopterella palustris CBS 459.81 TaxID=1314670 RepID=A0A8E2ED25_9PEZI|nr:hypothetical protein K432DRAFT_380969 [Lepidopterella palustris CBS 459.81]
MTGVRRLRACVWRLLVWSGCSAGGFCAIRAAVAVIGGGLAVSHQSRMAERHRGE